MFVLLILLILVMDRMRVLAGMVCTLKIRIMRTWWVILSGFFRLILRCLMSRLRRLVTSLLIVTLAVCVSRVLIW